MALTYATANKLKLNMSIREILELVTEGLDQLDCSEEDIQYALDYIDGVNDVVADDLSDGAKHAAFVIEEKLGWAEGVAESYGGRLHSLPIRNSDGGTPREFIAAVVSLGRFKLFSRRSSMPDDVRADYDLTISWLNRLADGRVTLNLGAAGTSVLTARGRRGVADRTDVSFNSSVY